MLTKNIPQQFDFAEKNFSKKKKKIKTILSVFKRIFNNLDRNEGLHLFNIKQLIHIDNELSDNQKVNKSSLPEIKNANGGIKKNYYD